MCLTTPAAPTPDTHAASSPSTSASTAAHASGRAAQSNTPSGAGTNSQHAVTAPSTPDAPDTHARCNPGISSATTSDGHEASVPGSSSSGGGGGSDRSSLLTPRREGAQLFDMPRIMAAVEQLPPPGQDPHAATPEQLDAITKMVQTMFKDALITLGCDNILTIYCSVQLAGTMEVASQYEAAQRQYRWTTARAKAVCGAQSMPTLEALLGMCKCLTWLNRPSNTLPEAQEAYGLALQLSGSSLRDTIELARAYLWACHSANTAAPDVLLQQAEEHLKQCKRSHGQLSRLALDLGCELCDCYQQLGRCNAVYQLLPMLVLAARAQ